MPSELGGWCAYSGTFMIARGRPSGYLGYKMESFRGAGNPASRELFPHFIRVKSKEDV